MILQKKCNILEIAAWWSHHCVGHGARGLTLDHLRKSGVWMISANSMVWHITDRCIICCRLREKLGFQKMAGYQTKGSWKQLHSPTQESIYLDQS